MKRHAEIAGAGIAGLSAAIMLARRGWSVRIHERSPEIRELGTGIQIKNNALEVLEDIGLFDRLLPLGFKLERSHHRDPAGRLMQERVLAGRSRVYVFLRQPLIEVLRIAAEEAGVPAPARSVSVPALYALAALGSLKARLTGKDAELSLKSVRMMRAEADVDHSKAVRELGWQPRPVEESIRAAARFWAAMRSARKAAENTSENSAARQSE